MPLPAPAQGHQDRDLAGPSPLPPLQGWQSFKGSFQGPPPLPPKGTSHLHREPSPWTPPAPPALSMQLEDAPLLAPRPFGPEGWPMGLAPSVPQGTHLPSVSSACVVLGAQGCLSMNE